MELDTELVISQGNLIEMDGHMWRIIEVDEERIILISMDKLVIKDVDSVGLFLDVQAGKYKQCVEAPSNVMPEVDDEIMARTMARVNAMESLLKDHYPEWDTLIGLRCRKKAFDGVVEETGLSVRYCKRLFVKYLRSGRNAFSLMDGRYFNRVQSEGREEAEGPLAVKIRIKGRAETDHVFRRRTGQIMLIVRNIEDIPL